jgi:hypothetical protein
MLFYEEELGFNLILNVSIKTSFLYLSIKILPNDAFCSMTWVYSLNSLKTLEKKARHPESRC